MTITSTGPRTSLARPGWLLLASLPPFVAFLFVAASTLRGKVEFAGELTPDQLAEIQLPWILMALLWLVPVLLGGGGLFLLAGRLRGRFAPAVRLLSAASMALVAAHFILQVTALGADGPTLSDSSAFMTGVALSVFGFWAGYLATITACIDLIRQRIARWPATIVAVLASGCLLLDVLTFLPAFVGEASLSETVGLPPFLLAVFWAVLGGGLVMSRVPSSE